MNEKTVDALNDILNTATQDAAKALATVEEISDDKTDSGVLYDETYLGRTIFNRGHFDGSSLPPDVWVWNGSTGKIYPYPNTSNMGVIVGVKINGEWHTRNVVSSEIRYRMTESSDMLIEISDSGVDDGIYPVCGRTIEISEALSVPVPVPVLSMYTPPIPLHARTNPKDTTVLSIITLVFVIVSSMMTRSYVKSAEQQIKTLSSNSLTIVKK